MRLALLFSGQGNQRPEHWRQVSRERARWPDDLPAIIPGIDDPEAGNDTEMLSRNVVAQPLIFAQQMAVWADLRELVPRPVAVAGYSLGEMAACCAAGVFSPEAGLRLCRQRAVAMDAAVQGEYAMLAVLGLDDAAVEAMAAQLGVALAIRNAPRHAVVAGPRAAIERAAERFAAAGASRLVSLAVRTPSHTPWLDAAAEAFRQQLAALPDRHLLLPVLSAIDGQPSRSAHAALDALARQIRSPLDWAACLNAVRELQPDVVLEIGPGNALSKLFAELAPEIPVRASDDFRSSAGIVDWLRRYA